MRHSKAKTFRPMEIRFPETGVFALESRHARGFAMPPTRHDYLKMLLLFAGEGRLRAGEGGQPAAMGDMTVVPPGCEHWIEDRRPLSLYAICFRAAEFSSGWPKWICESGRPWTIDGRSEEMLALARRLLHEQHTRSPGAVEMVRGLAWQMLALLARLPRDQRDSAEDAADPTGSRARVLEARRDLKHRFYEPVSLGEAAVRAGLGRRRFTQLFREVNGQTWWNALNAARLDHAERLLRETGRSVAAVAFECGYGDLSGFYRAWKGRHRASPQEWRLRGRATRPLSTRAEG